MTGGAEETQWREDVRAVEIKAVQAKAVEAERGDEGRAGETGRECRGDGEGEQRLHLLRGHCCGFAAQSRAGQLAQPRDAGQPLGHSALVSKNQLKLGS